MKIRTVAYYKLQQKIIWPLSNLPLQSTAVKGISMHIKEGTNIIFLFTKKTNTSKCSIKTAKVAAI